LTHIIEPLKLFTEYSYFSSYSDSFLAHAKSMADSLVSANRLRPGARVLELASNDGYLLQYFRALGMQVLGVEPAANVAAVAEQRGIPTLNRFFGSAATAEVLQRFGRADLIVGNNVLAHVPDINDFLSAVAMCLNSDAVAVFEFPYLRDLLDRTEFDTIYHEHVFYYSLTSLHLLALRAGLQVCDVERHSVHGGSLRVFMRMRNSACVSPNVARMLAQECTVGLRSAETYTSFADRVDALKERLHSLLQGLRAEGKTIAAYGAPAKGNTLLNLCGIGRELVLFTVDRSPHKQGKLLPGSRIPIYPPEFLEDRRPDYALLLAWNFLDEIVEQQQGYLRGGGRFILPIPEPIVL
jgi:SAM-dependent methyltransferase